MRALFLLLLFLLPPALAFGLNTWIVERLPPMPPMGVSEDGRFQPCPEGMDCLSTQDPADGIAPLAFEGDPDTALEAMRESLRLAGDAEVVYASGDYLHAVFVRRQGKLVEDVELVLDRANLRFHVRVFGRSGDQAQGVRSRFEEIALAWEIVSARTVGIDRAVDRGR